VSRSRYGERGPARRAARSNAIGWTDTTQGSGR